MLAPGGTRIRVLVSEVAVCVVQIRLAILMSLNQCLNLLEIPQSDCLHSLIESVFISIINYACCAYGHVSCLDYFFAVLIKFHFCLNRTTVTFQLN